MKRTLRAMKRTPRTIASALVASAVLPVVAAMTHDMSQSMLHAQVRGAYVATGGYVAMGADAVEQFEPGEGAGLGLSEYPANVLGLPDTAAREDVPTIDPRHILSLGLGGHIVLRFDRRPIVDHAGPDFTVFENAFRFVIGGRERIYAEPAEVSVSRDGVQWIPFPFDSLTLAGCAGVSPTSGGSNPGDPAQSGGDGFDLAALGLDSVRYVRLRDVTAMVKNSRSHPFWDPTLNGFDLDAVVALVAEPSGSSVVAESAARGATLAIAPNPCSARCVATLRIEERARVVVAVVDPLGRVVQVPVDDDLDAGAHPIAIDTRALMPGVYHVATTLDDVPHAVRRLVVVH